jgi:hypothetical protein
MVFQTFLQRKDQNFVGLFIWFAVLIWGISYFRSPCVAWWRLDLYFILHTSYFKRKPLQVVAVWLGGVRGG